MTVKPDVKHTPGPWEIYQYMGCREYQIRDTAQKLVVERIHDNKEAAQNARLIAAAPELLEALRGLLRAESPDYVQSWDIAREQALAALAKATGEGVS